MRIGFVGLGKLGLPCALAIEAAGHEVMGYDINHDVWRSIAFRDLPYMEKGANELLATTRITQKEPDELAEWAEIVFIAVQTPHQPQYEGITRLPDEREDFGYEHLAEAVLSVRNAKLVVVISTVLPGTMDRFERLGYIDRENLLYNPFFIAMGTTIPDFRNPEFILIGTDHAHPGPLLDLYASIHSKQVFVTTVKTAELTKVLYNTYISLKIAFANTVMELSEKTGADCDDVIDALSLADQRIMSPMYLRGGMGDGGGCHPRDNIALSWLAREKSLSYDLFEAIMECRERQTEWIADLAQETERPVVIQGMAYKPGTNLTVGSPALLLGSILEERGIPYSQEDPYVEEW